MKKINVLWLIPFIAISGIIGYFTNAYVFFDFKYEIDLISLLSLIISSSIGIYIATSLHKNIEAHKFEKGLNYKLIYSLLSKVKSINKYLQNNSLRFNETIKVFKDMSSIISEMKELNDICRVVNDQKIIDVRNNYTEIKILITDSPTNQNYLNVSARNKTLSEAKIRELIQRLNFLIIEINRT